MNNIFIGGKQYNECYLKKCIKPCRLQNNPQAINPVLVRSRECQDRQNFSKQIVNLEKKMRRLEKQFQLISNQILSPIVNDICKIVTNSGLLVQSKNAIIYMNWSRRGNTLYRRLDRLARLTNNTQQINKIAINFRFQEGVRRYNLCNSMTILNKRMNLMQTILNQNNFFLNN